MRLPARCQRSAVSTQLSVQRSASKISRNFFAKCKEVTEEKLILPPCLPQQIGRFQQQRTESLDLLRCCRIDVGHAQSLSSLPASGPPALSLIPLHVRSSP